MAYKVVRTDRLTGTHNPAYLRSAKFFDESDKPAKVENGTLVVIGDLIDEERELYKVTKADENTPKDAKIGLVAGVEIEYDEKGYHGLETYANEEDKPIRVYILNSNDMYGVSDDDTEKGTKITVGSVTVKAADKEPCGRLTYTVYEVD